MNRAERAILQSHVRIERMELLTELRPLQKRIATIYDRLRELDKADALLENE